VSDSPQILAIIGPTAVGKTSIGIQVAMELNGEIVSADARQIYRGMDVGTAKPTKEELGTVPHHMIDITDPGEYFSAGIYGEQGREVVSEILSRGKLPIITGGSGLYFRSLIDGLFEGESWSEELRDKIAAEIESDGVEAAYKRLLTIDEDYAQTISSNDKLRISRALEVYEKTGKTLSESFAQQNLEGVLNTFIIGLRMDRKLLIGRIEERVDEMFESGLLDEVKKLLDAGNGDWMQKVPTIGYSEVIDFLDGKFDEEQMIRDIKTNSRRYSKRQMTWFRNDDRINWIDMDLVEDAEGEIITMWNRASQDSD